MTLKILKNESNRLILTLSELASESLPSNWLFIFTNEQTNDVVGTLYLSDTSTHTERYNEFVLIEPTDLEFTTGDYQYDVYQMPDGGSLDITEGVHVEIGKVRVFDLYETEPEIYTAQKVNKVYEH